MAQRVNLAIDWYSRTSQSMRMVASSIVEVQWRHVRIPTGLEE
jgi:hypothetical protein